MASFGHTTKFRHSEIILLRLVTLTSVSTWSHVMLAGQASRDLTRYWAAQLASCRISPLKEEEPGGPLGSCCVLHAIKPEV